LRHPLGRSQQPLVVIVDAYLIAKRFPRAAKYNPEWVLAGVSGAAHPLWMAEWLTGVLPLKAGMRVLDLGCGRALSSIFLHREFGVQVWAVDLWFSAAENSMRVADAGAEDGVLPINADARDLPFDAEFFDAIVSLDSFFYYGTDEQYLPYVARFLKPGGVLGIAGAGLVREFDGDVPEHLRTWWQPDMWCLHSAEWWRHHWARTGILDVEVADTMADGGQLWLDWHRVIAPNNAVELAALEADRGQNITYVRAVGRRTNLKLAEPITAVHTQYTKKPLFPQKHSSAE
jgi:SAM-dependent methyltransferase